MRKYLRDTAEFQHVYRNGKRYEGVFITAFVIENQELNHRLGSDGFEERPWAKRCNGIARNDYFARRFDQMKRYYASSRRNYDWVLNAKAAVLSQKVDAPSEELKGIIEKVGRLETRDPLSKR